MVQVTVEVEGVEQLGNGLADAAGAVAPELRRAMDTSLLLIERDARTNVRQDTRALMNSISHSTDTRGGSLIGKVGPSKGYGFWVHEGRKPGKMPPIEAVAGWARRHGINPFLVARAIGRKGTKPNPFMDVALEKNARRIQDLFEQVGAKIAVVVKR